MYLDLLKTRKLPNTVPTIIDEVRRNNKNDQFRYSQLSNTMAIIIYFIITTKSRVYKITHHILNIMDR